MRVCWSSLVRGMEYNKPNQLSVENSELYLEVPVPVSYYVDFSEDDYLYEPVFELNGNIQFYTPIFDM